MAKRAGSHDVGSEQLPLARMSASRGAVNTFYNQFVDELGRGVKRPDMATVPSS
jgi:hypothetical protein